MVTQKETERHFLLRFAVLSKLLSTSDLRDSESPDFLCSVDGHVLGIEVRELFVKESKNTRPLKADESEADGIVEAARRHCESAVVPPLNVIVGFKNPSGLTKKHRKPLTSAIAELVTNNVPTQGVKISIRDDQPHTNLPPEIYSIHIIGLSSASKHVWCAPAGGIYVENCAPTIQAAIDVKALKLELYSEKCDRCWLLLAASGTNASSFLSPDHATRIHVFSSPFDRTFFLNDLDDDWIELITSGRMAG